MLYLHYQNKRKVKVLCNTRFQDCVDCKTSKPEFEDSDCILSLSCQKCDSTMISDFTREIGSQKNKDRDFMTAF